MIDPRTITLRLARPGDEQTLERLALLDSAARVRTPALLAILDGEPVAALSLVDGRAVSNPFIRTADAVALLRDRAAQHSGPPRRRERKALRLRPRVAV